MATIWIDNSSPQGMACTKCHHPMIAPRWSAYVNNHEVRHVWSCENCGREIEMAVNLRIDATSDWEPSKSAESSIVA